MSKTTQAQPQARRRQAVKPKKSRPRESTIFSLTLVALMLGGVLAGFSLFGVTGQASQTPPPAEAARPVVRIMPPGGPVAPTVAATALELPTAQRPIWAHVGLVSGHKGYDPGAVCSDGLTEAEVNYMVALEAASLLARRGVSSDVLDEFDERLTGYQADALVSIHADSCNIPGASGFKVARVTNSAIPEAEDLLVACLNDEYGTYTGLPQHPASITDGMTNYHAFREIANHTPGAIIETGFLLDDRYLLQHKPKVVARGIAAGILCFLEQPAGE